MAAPGSDTQEGHHDVLFVNVLARANRAADLPLAPPMASGTWAILKVLSCLRPVGILSSSPNTSSISRGRKLAYLYPSDFGVLIQTDRNRDRDKRRGEFHMFV